ncbi:MAG: transposase [Calditrichaceae bacterium]
MSRYSVLHEKSFSRNFKKPFDFTELNHRLILETIPEENKKMAAIDASFVPKSGKHSYGIDYFWSGVAGKSKKGRKSHLWQLLIWTIIPPTIFLLSRHLPAVELAKKRKIELIFTCSKFNVTRITCVLIVSFILRLMDLLLHLTRPQHR